jgi:hypothetical protein
MPMGEFVDRARDLDFAAADANLSITLRRGPWSVDSFAELPSIPTSTMKPLASSTWLPGSTHWVAVSPAMQNPAPHAARA